MTPKPESELPALFSGYDTGGFYDEMFESPGVPRPHYERLYRQLSQMGPPEFQ
jgi:uncharacterized circularly permuted ATP-grasp superfamily protein